MLLPACNPVILWDRGFEPGFPTTPLRADAEQILFVEKTVDSVL